VNRAAFILKGYPRLSETFIAQEIHALEQRGLDIRIVSLRHPTDRQRHPIHGEIAAPVTYLPEYLHQEPLRVWQGWHAARRLPGYAEAYAVWRSDLERDRTRNRVRRFGQACVLAAELPADIHHLHAHFLHTPASVTRYAAMMRRLPWTCSAHAKDIYTSPDWELREKLDDLDWLVTCTAANVDHLGEIASPAARDKLHLVYHGLDFSRFPQPQPNTGSGPVHILSVGRAVEKKGYPGLLRALAALPSDLEWRFIHIGGGTLANDLKRQSDELGLSDRIEWRGAQSQEAVIDAYRECDLFVLNSRIAGDGDRDGLPNVLMEAQSQQLACIATRVSAIPELIVDGETGLLVPPDDDTALSGALAELIRDSDRRRALAAAGCDRVRSRFSMSGGIDTLAGLFGLSEREQRKAV